MQTFLATIVDAGGDVVVENTAVRTLMPVRPDEPGWSGSFDIDRELVRPFQAGDSVWFRISTGEELPAVISAVCLGEVFFSSRSTAPNEYAAR
jgi:hypothetical protein